MIYFDSHSTTKTDPRVIKSMMPYFTEDYGNASAFHEMGEKATEAVEKARGSVAKIIKADPKNIYFTSGATEANNIVLAGGQWSSIRSSNIEHMSILGFMEEKYYNGKIRVERDGLIDVNKLEEYIQDEFVWRKVSSLLLTIMAANNEIGTIQPIKEIRAMSNKYDIIYHTDATQAIGKTPITVDDADIITLSSHKIYGPKGIGAVYISDKIQKDEMLKIRPLTFGGFQETITSGTLNVPAIVGFGKACEILMDEGETENKRVGGLRDRFFSILQNNLSGVRLNGSWEHRLYNNLNISIDDISSDALTNIKGLCCSTGSACKRLGKDRVSHVIEAIGADKNSVRFGFGRFNTDEEIDIAAQKIIEVVKEIRNV